MRSNATLSALLRASVAKLCAACLCVLAVLPFTAPFAAMDLAGVGGSPTQRVTLQTADDAPAPDVCVHRVHLMAARHLLSVTSPVAGDTSAVSGWNVMTPAASPLAHDLRRSSSPLRV
jgi:hypothetical protein